MQGLLSANFISKNDAKCCHSCQPVVYAKKNINPGELEILPICHFERGRETTPLILIVCFRHAHEGGYPES